MTAATGGRHITSIGRPFTPETRTPSTRRAELWRYGRRGIDALGALVSDGAPAALDRDTIALFERDPNAPLACAGAPLRLLDR